MLFAILLLAGLGVRLALLPVEAGPRVGVWKIWSVNAAELGIAPLYGSDDPDAERPLLELDGRRSAVSSPPGILYGLGVVGQLYARYGPGGEHGRALTVAVKLPILLAELLLILLIYVAARRLVEPSVARWSVLAYWINPAVMLSGAGLGFLAPLFVLPAAGSLVLATWGYPAMAGVLFATALFTDFQAVVMAPVLAIALARRAPLRTEASMWATGAAVLTSIAILTPMALAGSLPAAVRLFAGSLRLDSATRYATDLWRSIPEGLGGIETAVRAATTSALSESGGRDLVSHLTESLREDAWAWLLALLVLLGLWAMWRARSIRFLPGWAGLAAILIHATSVLALGVWPNALFLAIPFLALAAAECGQYRPLISVVSLLLLANLVLFTGAPDPLPLGSSIAVSLANAARLLLGLNLVALLWHALVFSNECTMETPRSWARAQAERVLAARYR